MTDVEKITIIRDFVKQCYQTLGIRNSPEIIITNDVKWCRAHRTYGSYSPSTATVTAYLGKRNLADFLRTLGHELVHHAQNERGELEEDSGETGSDIENQANSQAGVLLRNYGKFHDVIYENKKKDNFRKI
jgi:hypothetical protein